MMSFRIMLLKTLLLTLTSCQKTSSIFVIDTGNVETSQSKIVTEFAKQAIKDYEELANPNLKLENSLTGLSCASWGSGTKKYAVTDLSKYTKRGKKKAWEYRCSLDTSISLPINAFDYITFFQKKNCPRQDVDNVKQNQVYNNYQSKHSFATGEEIIFTCLDGYEHSKYPMKCFNGKWSTKEPCGTKNVCKGLKDPARGKITYYNQNSGFAILGEGTQAKLECGEGYETKGESSATCHDGQWSKIIGTCEIEHSFLIPILVGVLLLFILFLVALRCCYGSSHVQEDRSSQTETIPSINLRIDVNEDDFGEELFNSTEMKNAVKNMFRIGHMMNDFDDHLKQRERSLDEIEHEMDVCEKRVEGAMEEIEMLESPKKIEIVGNEKIDAAESQAANLERKIAEFEKGLVEEEKSLDEIENDMDDCAQRVAEEIERELQVCSFSPDELRSFMLVRKPKTFEKFQKELNAPKWNPFRTVESASTSRDTISELLSHEMKQIVDIPEFLDFETFKKQRIKAGSE